MEIKEIVVVTEHGVSFYNTHDNKIIQEDTYSVCGDPYPCFKVIKDGEVIDEIRCVHNLTIKYKEK